MWTHAPQRVHAVSLVLLGRAESACTFLRLDLKPVECQETMQSRQTLSQTYMLSSSMLPLSVSSGSQLPEAFRLPSLPKATHGRTTTAPLSISEPFLLKPRHWPLFGESSRNCCPQLQRHAPSLPSCKTPENTAMPQQSYHQVYMHFCQPLRPISKVRKTCPRVQRQTTERRALRPLVRQCKQPLDSETLSVRGKTCLPSQPLPTTSSRKEVHIFLPAEGEEDSRDSESVDEGFMDELDNKITTLKL